MQQTIRITRTADGVNLAWSSAGRGPTLVKASNWLTHLEFDWDSPVWRHWIRFLAGHFHLIRYDERGCGMSDWDVADLSQERWFDDFDAVVKVAKPEPPFVLLGISQGGAAAISYASRYPERVSHLILYGAYSRGWAERDSGEDAQRYLAITELTKLGWGKNNPVYRQLFTARFIPGATQEQIDWFNELCRRTTTPDTATRMMRERGRVNVTGLLSKIKVPTLVLHAVDDEAVPLSEGKLLATGIANAHFVQLESSNHILLEDEPAWARFKEAVLAFTGVMPKDDEEDPLFGVLTPREREILLRIAGGCTNAEIGRQLFISEKTVRNHVTKVFDKLGVQSRAQAIVLAKDKRLQARVPA
jgi:pimeloyl-ACP methyl ester carboxylesterase/DNA-binding CsgD family transcriptional regulator